MLQALPFALGYLTAATLLAGLWLGGWGTFLTPAVVFVALPLADLLGGHDTTDTAPDDVDPPAFDQVLRGWVLVQTATLGVALWYVTTHDLTAVEWVGATLSAALMTGGGGITVAHELMHRRDRVDRALAEGLMTLATYPHFCVEHVLGHHKHVGTPEDPATARRGESFYAFYPRVVLGSLRSAWALEARRTRRRDIPWWSWRNRRLRYALDVVGISVAVGLLSGPVGLAFFWLQGVGAFTLLELVNYVEHYGLQRQKTARGRWERVQPRHSWNANHRVSNWWLYNLQRHADHHAWAARPYYHLRAVEEGPQLPFSYPTAILVALVPPLWRAVMHPRLDRSSVAEAA